MAGGYSQGMNAQELIDDVIAEYHAADLPVDPTARVAALHDIVWQRWSALPLPDRAATAADLEGVGTPASGGPHVVLDDVSDLDESAVDSLTSVIRAQIPELSVPEV
jgi:hypothetical protein